MEAVIHQLLNFIQNTKKIPGTMAAPGGIIIDEGEDARGVIDGGVLITPLLKGAMKRGHYQGVIKRGH